MSEVSDYWKPELEKANQRARLAGLEAGRLRKGIQDYIEGNFGPDFPTKHDKCPHDRFGWEDCGNCIDEHFLKLLAASDQ